MPIKEYEVIAIPTSKTVLINYGLKDGAKQGETLRIIQKGTDIIVNGKNYGSYDAVKAVIEINMPYEKFSECKIFKYFKVNVLSPLQSLMQQTRKESQEFSKITLTNTPTPPPITPIILGDVVQLTNE